MAAKVAGCRRIIISRENLPLLGTKYSYVEYGEFFDEALAPLTISDEQLLNVPESVEQEEPAAEEPEAEGDGPSDGGYYNNAEPQYNDGFDFGDDFYQ